MEVSTTVMHKRRKLASDLRKLNAILYHYFPNAEISSIESAISSLNDREEIFNAPNLGFNPDFWGYSINSLVFKFTKIPRHTLPSDCGDLKLIFDLKVVGNSVERKGLHDPFVWLEFNIVLEATKLTEESCEQLFTSYHLDKHIIGGDDPEFPHPIYHFQFGGRKLGKRDLNTGNLLILDSPRIGHYPMEAILGIDFIISNFFPEKWERMRNESPEYLNLIEEYQELYVKPYIHTHASKWDYFPEMILTDKDWNHSMIHPQLA